MHCRTMHYFTIKISKRLERKKNLPPPRQRNNGGPKDSDKVRGYYLSRKLVRAVLRKIIILIRGAVRLIILSTQRSTCLPPPSPPLDGFQGRRINLPWPLGATRGGCGTCRSRWAGRVMPFYFSWWRASERLSFITRFLIAPPPPPSLHPTDATCCLASI